MRCCAGSDHPRTRGVYKAMSVALRTFLGSSPHARGLRCDDERDDRDDGIIPARAGFTRCRRFRRPWAVDHPRTRGVYSTITKLFLTRGDHPRTRGVYVVTVRVLVTTGGSSPHARGLHVSKAALVRAVRIIPARAGFTPG